MSLINIVFYLLRNNLQLPEKKIVLLNLVLFFGIASFYFIQSYYFLGMYPDAKSKLFDFEHKEIEWKHKEIKKINDEINESYDYQSEKFRVMFLGNVTNLGSGGSKNTSTFVKIAEDLLNNKVLTRDKFYGNSNQKYEFINAGVNGSSSTELLEYYRNEWIKYRPKVTVVNLSFNDNVSKIFTDNLQKLIDLNNENNIKTVFVLEASSPEVNPNGLFQHKAMVDIAEKNSILYYDLYSYLKLKSQTGDFMVGSSAFITIWP